ncbi:GNAT family N-acetyltransferase [Actinoallomurus rhizosphaericola]|uniref:GNAT family N-acetyltransferase n=1 Tax=Actinoallomurus rhizosphaericola TaxID=2952536 RepID=UPI0020907EAC|nr:GNAT family N-acetyltransferase [Actinoallomurus rhizosphaericola]MCO5993484.1 GNAT family N-acetyltransferase [Actinoallomurus rhizosphaericola]
MRPDHRAARAGRIVTRRLVLDRLERGPARALAEGDCSGVVPARGWPTDATAIVAHRAATDAEALTWLIQREGAVIGECGLKHAPDADGVVEIGYGLGAPWRSQGYGTEAIRGLLSRLEESPAYRGVTAEVHEGNLPSRRLLERLGFAVDDLTPPYVWYARALR